MAILPLESSKQPTVIIKDNSDSKGSIQDAHKWPSKQGTLCLIEVPPKIWRPKMASKYTIPDYADNDLDDILDYGKFGKCVYRTELKWDSGAERSNMISFNLSEHEDELKKI